MMSLATSKMKLWKPTLPLWHYSRSFMILSSTRTPSLSTPTGPPCSGGSCLLHNCGRWNQGLHGVLHYGCLGRGRHGTGQWQYGAGQWGSALPSWCPLALSRSSSSLLLIMQYLHLLASGNSVVDFCANLQVKVNLKGEGSLLRCLWLVLRVSLPSAQHFVPKWMYKGGKRYESNVEFPALRAGKVTIYVWWGKRFLGKSYQTASGNNIVTFFFFFGWFFFCGEKHFPCKDWLLWELQRSVDSVKVLCWAWKMKKIIVHPLHSPSLKSPNPLSSCPSSTSLSIDWDTRVVNW